MLLKLQFHSVFQFFVFCFNQGQFRNDDHGEDMVTISTEYENIFKAFLHNNICSLLKLVQKTNLDMYSNSISKILLLQI